MRDWRADDHLLRRARVYDDVAGVYERVNAPCLFDAPARELALLVAPPPGTRVLDVGSGTGAVGRAILAAVPDAQVVALDPSTAMLQAARRGGIERIVAGLLPRLPFADRSFDVLVSGFVLTHVDDPDAAIGDMRRVLRPGGMIGLSAWGPATDQYARAWADVVHGFVPAESLSTLAGQVLPGDERFSRPEGLGSVLSAGGFGAVAAVTRTLEFAMTVDAFVEAREVCASGRALRVLLGDEDWERCRVRARTELAGRFPRGVRFSRDVYFATARR